MLRKHKIKIKKIVNVRRTFTLQKFFQFKTVNKIIKSQIKTVHFGQFQLISFITML